MNKRIAKKILTQTDLHWAVYFNGSLYSLVPKKKSKTLYLKACKYLRNKSYYDSEWLNHIYGHYVDKYPNVPSVAQYIKMIERMILNKHYDY